jgi:hypothetical protein
MILDRGSPLCETVTDSLEMEITGLGGEGPGVAVVFGLISLLGVVDPDPRWMS